MTDLIKGWIYGFIMGGGQLPTKDRSPVEIPVQSIQLGYTTDTMQLGEGNQLITAYVYPTNASNQNLEWSSSDETIAVVIRNENSSSAIIQTIGTGDVVITAKATDSSNVQQSMNLHVIAGITFETLEYKSNTFSEISKYAGQGIIMFNYTPVAQKGEHIKIVMNPPISDGQMQWKVRDTFFDNIKLIETDFESSNPKDYWSTSGNQQGYVTNTDDGSGLSIANRNISIGTDVMNALFGVNNTNTSSNQTIECGLGLKVCLFGASSITSRLQSIHNNNGQAVSIEIISGGEYINIDNDFIVTGLSLGQAKVKAIIGDYLTITYTINVQEGTGTGIPNINWMDDNGNIIDDTDGLMIGTNLRFRPVVSSRGAEFISITPNDTEQIHVNEDLSIVPLKPGSLAMNVVYKYFRSGSLFQNTRRVTLYIWGNKIYCGKAESSFLKSEQVIWCSCNGPRNFNFDSFQNIDIVVNANDIKILDTFYTRNSLISGNNDWQIKLTVLGSNTISTSNIYNIQFFHIRKLTTSPTTVRFQMRGFEDTVYDEMQI